MERHRHSPGHSLDRRRFVFAARRILAACCAALAVLCALQVLDGTVRRVPVVVAAADVARGERIAAAGLAVVDVPASAITDGAYASVDEIGAVVAAAPIARGQPLYPGMVSAVPAAPAGSTVIEVTLASVPDRLMAGDRVDLVSSVGCVAAGSLSVDADAEDSGAGGAGGDDSRTEACVLASDALTLSAPSGGSSSDVRGDGGSTSGPFSATGSRSARGADAVSFALDADEALRVLAHEEAGPLLAVLSADAPGRAAGNTPAAAPDATEDAAADPAGDVIPEAKGSTDGRVPPAKYGEHYE